MILNNISGPTKALLLSVLAFLVLYFGFSKISPEVKNPEKSGDSIKIENDFTSKASDFIDSLSEGQKSQVLLLNEQYTKAVNDSQKIELLKQISGFWYQSNRIGLAADYALEVAKLENTGDAWTLAATNYVLAIKQNNGSATDMQNWLEQARALFDKAINIDSANVTYQLNKALLKVEFPADGQPMEGILALRSLNEKNPDHPVILYHLARLAIETNQWDRAKERLNHLLLKNPDYNRAYCLMLRIAEHEKNAQAIKSYTAKCKDG